MNHEINFVFKDINIECKHKTLIVENRLLRRVFDLSNGVPRTVSIVDKSNGMIIAGENPNQDFSFIGINMPGEDKDVNFEIKEITVSEKASSIFDGERVELEIVIHENVQQVFFKRKYIIYPELPIIASRTSIKCYTSPNVFWSRRGDSFNDRHENCKLESCAESISMAEEMKASKIVEFTGRTDYTNDQVVEHPANKDLLNGNLLFCSNESGSGIFMLQEAPPSMERRDFEKHDFRISGSQIFSCGWGIEPHDAKEDELQSYRHVIGIYPEDGTAGTSILKKYLKIRFPVDIEKNCSVMVNPWGCNCFRELLSETFLKEEFQASKEIHATHYQIDDGWQAGKTLQELENNNRCAGEDFWKINYDLLPNGFEPVLKCAKELGVEAALWVAPSANRHYRDWKDFADILYGYYTEYGFKYIKIDYVKTRTKDAEDNLEKMLRYLREKSEGQIYFNLDTTNGQRSGYFMFLEYGNIFLENRYVKWGLGYHPEDTLNNFWNLSKYMRPQSLQIEFCDPDIIDDEFYQKRGTSRPDVYSCDYWAAIAMFANPLVWLAPSRLSEKVKKIYRDIIDLHLKYKKEIFEGEIYPIGNEPDGKSITGLQSHNSETGEGIFILYCEKDAPLSGIVSLKLLDENAQYNFSEIFYKEETPILVQECRDFAVEFEQQGSWKMFKYTV